MTTFHAPDTAGREVPWPEPETVTPNGRRSRTWIAVVAVVVVAIVLAGSTWWMLDSTVPESDYDEAVAELDATRTDLEATQSELEATQADLEAARTELREAAAARDAADAKVDGAQEVAVASALMELNIGQEALDVYLDAGGDPGVLEDVLADLGYGDITIQEWIDTWGDLDGAWAKADRAVHATGDDVLIDFWTTWNLAPVGSDEELVAWVGMFARLEELMLERLDDAAEAAETETILIDG